MFVIFRATIFLENKDVYVTFVMSFTFLCHDKTND